MDLLIWYLGGWRSETVATDAAPLTRDGLRDELQRALTHYATKADLADLRDEMRRAMAHYATKADLAELRDELRIELNRTLAHYATKADVADMRADLQATRAECKADLHSLTRCMVVAVLGSVTAAAAVTGLIVRFFS